MLQPKRTKYRRPQKGRCKGNAQRGNQLAFGSFGIKSLDTHWLTGRQIEAARIAMTRYMQREGQSWIRIFPDKPITKKPADVRMGRVRVIPWATYSPSLRAVSSSKSKVCLSKWPRRLSAWLLRSCPLLLNSLLDTTTTKTPKHEDFRNSSNPRSRAVTAHC